MIIILILGTHITSVKSVELDSFQPQMVQMLEIGGNENFRSYLLTLSLPIAGPSKKYGVPEVLYYSEILKAKIESREPNPYEEAYWQGLIPCTDTTSTKTVAPWVPDSSNSHCMICSKPFSLLFRKHHCRRCGKLICGECGPGENEFHFLLICIERFFIYMKFLANNARPILEWGIKDPVRHCKNCYKSPAIDWK